MTKLSLSLWQKQVSWAQIGSAETLAAFAMHPELRAASCAGPMGASVCSGKLNGTGHVELLGWSSDPPVLVFKGIEQLLISWFIMYRNRHRFMILVLGSWATHPIKTCWSWSYNSYHYLSPGLTHKDLAAWHPTKGDCDVRLRVHWDCLSYLLNPEATNSPTHKCESSGTLLCSSKDIRRLSVAWNTFIYIYIP